MNTTTATPTTYTVAGRTLTLRTDSMHVLDIITEAGAKGVSQGTLNTKAFGGWHEGQDVDSTIDRVARSLQQLRAAGMVGTCMDRNGRSLLVAR